MADNDFKYTKFCGLGVTYEGETPWGVQIRLMPSAIVSPARLVGLQDGDVISAVFAEGRWQPMMRMPDFFRLLGGIEGERIPMVIQRGIPLPKPDMDQRRHRPDEESPARWLGVTPETLRLEAIRARIYPYLTEDAIPDNLASIPFQSLDAMLACVPMSRLEHAPAEQTRLAFLEPDVHRAGMPEIGNYRN